MFSKGSGDERFEGDGGVDDAKRLFRTTQATMQAATNIMRRGATKKRTDIRGQDSRLFIHDISSFNSRFSVE